MDEELVRKIQRSSEIIKEVVSDRGYDVSEENRLVESDIYEELSMEFFKGDEKIMIFWMPSLGANIRENIEKMKRADCQRSIIISTTAPNHWAKAIITNIKRVHIYIDTYTLDEAQINITKHVYVPKHEICTTIEKKRILKQYSVTLKQVPEIAPTDPVVRHFGATKGQMFRITRMSETMGKPYISFRVVG